MLRSFRALISVALAATCARHVSTASLQFDGGVMLETDADESANVSIGDLNGDGNLDILLVKGRHSPRVDRVLLGDGRGAFPVVRDLSTRADRSYAGLLVDVDRDGDLDVVISNDSPDPKIVHVNDGTGRFTVGSTYGQSTWVTRNAAVADMNGDSGREFREVRFGDNKGTVYGFATGDVNKDGRTDIAVARSGAQNMLYLGISR